MFITYLVQMQLIYSRPLKRQTYSACVHWYLKFNLLYYVIRVITSDYWLNGKFYYWRCFKHASHVFGSMKCYFLQGLINTVHCVACWYKFLFSNQVRLVECVKLPEFSNRWRLSVRSVFNHFLVCSQPSLLFWSILEMFCI